MMNYLLLINHQNHILISVRKDQQQLIHYLIFYIGTHKLFAGNRDPLASYTLLDFIWYYSFEICFDGSC